MGVRNWTAIRKINCILSCTDEWGYGIERLPKDVLYLFIDWQMNIEHGTAIQITCYIFSWTEERASTIGRLAERSATNFDGLKIWLPASDVSKRCAASFHRLTNEHLAWNGYPKDLLCLFRGLANGRPELDGYLNDLMYLFMDWRTDIQHRTASRKICCVF